MLDIIIVLKIGIILQIVHTDELNQIVVSRIVGFFFK